MLVLLFCATGAILLTILFGILVLKDDWGHAWQMVMACIVGIVAVVIIVCIPFYYAAGVKAELYNDTFGTNITADRMFYAGEEQKEIIRQQMQRNKNRYEITIPEGLLEKLK